MAAVYVIDTNFLVRIITYDVPELAHQAEEKLNPLDDETVKLPLYVLAEVVYVLAYNKNYLYSRHRISHSLTKIIDIHQFSLQRDQAKQALNMFNLTKLDFVDCLLAAHTYQHGQQLLSFDKALLKEIAKHSDTYNLY